MRWQRLGVLATVVALAVPFASSAADKAVVQRPASAVTLPMERPLPPLDGATGWLNSPPLTVAGLRGIRIRVTVDGQPPGAAHGLDIDELGNGTVTDQRLYQLIRQPAAVRDRRFEIEFLDPGVEAFAFTFG